MRRYLVVANQTLLSAPLAEAMRARLAGGPCSFHIVVPVDRGQGLTWTEGTVRASATRQLEEATRTFAEEGVEVDGEVSDVGPVEGVAAVLAREGRDAFEEVIISTLPLGISRWIRMDAPHRIERTTGLPVHHVVAQPARA